ncbi:MAG: YMGG-like glycine zipper-containing protein [Planctomycetes bacterium]|nr:YMGG-like glycine zipper-containing protein [Planctomycetota bacterium]
MRRSILAVLVLALIAVPFTGCKSSNTGSWIGTGVGAASGALIGGIIGHQSDNKWTGVLIGAGAGALAGYIVGTELGTDSESEDPAPADPNAEYERARGLFDQANREPDPQRAIDLYQESIAIDGRFPEPHNNMGLRYIQLSRRDMARTCFEKALAVDPQYQPARDNLTRLNYGAL